MTARQGGSRVIPVPSASFALLGYQARVHCGQSKGEPNRQVIVERCRIKVIFGVTVYNLFHEHRRQDRTSLSAPAAGKQHILDSACFLL